MQFAGFAEGLRRLFIGLLTGLGIALGIAPGVYAQEPSLSPDKQAIQWYGRGLVAQQAGRMGVAADLAGNEVKVGGHGGADLPKLRNRRAPRSSRSGR